MDINNRTVMVTGGAGFIGSALARELLREGASVVIFDNFVSGDMANLEEIRTKVKIIEGDVRDGDFAEKLVDAEVEVLFHLAAEPYIPGCYDRPRNFFDVNATGTLNVMLACLEAGVERILHYSSSEIYGTAKHVPMNEDHPTFPHSTYAASKLAADRLCYTLHHEQGLPVIILRQFNVFGPRETHPYIIPELISQLSQRNIVRVGNVNASRDLTYVDDAVRGAVRLVQDDRAVGSAINLGTGKHWLVSELAEMIGGLLEWGKVEFTVEKGRLRPLDVDTLCCDYTKIRNLIGWEPKITFAEGLRKTIEWYESNQRQWVWERKMGSEDELWKNGKKKTRL